MDQYQHYVSGFFADLHVAETAFSAITSLGIPRAQLSIFGEGVSLAKPPPTSSSDTVLNDMLVDGAIGTAVGTGLGVLAGVMLAAANVTIFIATPLLAPLMLLGWGASLGGIIGATAGASNQHALADLIRDATTSGQIVLVVETKNLHETQIAQKVIQAAVGECNNISTAAV